MWRRRGKRSNQITKTFWIPIPQRQKIVSLRKNTEFRFEAYKYNSSALEESHSYPLIFFIDYQISSNRQDQTGLSESKEPVIE